MRAVGIQQRQVPRLRDEGTGLRCLAQLPPLNRQASRRPRPEAAVEYPDRRVAEVAQQPPGAGRRRRIRVVVHHDRPVRSHPQRAHRRGEGVRARQGVPPASTRTSRRGEILVKVGEDRAGKMPLGVHLRTGRAAQLPPHVEQEGGPGIAQRARKLVDADEDVSVCHLSSMAASGTGRPGAARAARPTSGRRACRSGAAPEARTAWRSWPTCPSRRRPRRRCAGASPRPPARTSRP